MERGKTVRTKLLMLFIAIITLVSMTIQPAEAGTAAELRRSLNVISTSAWVRMYERNNFDCSNMSALLDFILDTLGYEAYILAGNTYKVVNGTPTYTGGHAMVLVFCTEPSIAFDSVTGYEIETTKRVPYWIESTNLSMFPAYSVVNDYFIPTAAFDTAQQAYAAMPWEYTWSLDDVERIFDTMIKPSR